MQLAQMAGQRIARVERRVVQQSPDVGQRHIAFAIQQHLLQPVNLGGPVATVSVRRALRAHQPQLVIVVQRAHRAPRQRGQFVHRVAVFRLLAFHELPPSFDRDHIRTLHPSVT